MRKILMALALVLGVGALLSGCVSGTDPKPAQVQASPGSVANLDPAAVQARLKTGGLLVLDVREDWEFKDGHIPGATLIPLGSLETHLRELDPAAPVVVVCRSGNRSAQGAEILAKAGFKSVYNMSGGMNQWKGAVEK